MRLFYGDLTLRDSADACAWGELTRAIRRAVEAAVGEGEIVDALVSVDPGWDRAEALELVEWTSTHEERLQALNARILRDLLGGDD
jgi:hypothetical protein